MKEGSQAYHDAMKKMRRTLTDESQNPPNTPEESPNEIPSTPNKSERPQMGDTSFKGRYREPWASGADRATGEKEGE